MADRELKVIITGDASSLQRAFKKADTGASRLGKGFKTLAIAGAAAGAALGVAVAVGAKKAIDAASNLNEQINKSKVVFKDSSKEVIDWSDDLASSFGLSQRAALEAAGTFGNMLVPMGLARKQAADMSQNMVELAGDMASFNNASPAETLDAIRAGLAGETEPLRRFGVFLSAARVQEEALAETHKKNAKELTTAEKATAAYNIILKDTKDTQGDFARSAGDSMANQLRIASAEFENMAASIGQVLLPYALELLKWVNAHMPEIQAVIQTSLNAVISTIEFIGPIIQKLIGWFQDLGAFAQKHWGEVQAAAERVVEWYKGTLAPAVENVLSALQAFWEKFGGAITKIAKEAFNAVWLIVKTVLANIASIVQAFLAVLGGDWEQAWNEVKEIPKRTIGAVVGILRGALTIFKTAALALGKAVMDGLGAGIEAGWGKVKEFVQGIPGKIKTNMGNVGHLLYEAGKAILGGLLDGLKKKFEDIKNFVLGIGTWIKDHKGPEEEDRRLLFAAGQLIIQGLEDGMRMNWGKLQAWVGRLGDELQDKVGGAVDKAIAAIESRRSAFGDAFTELTSNALSAFDTLSDQILTKTEKKIARQDAQRAAAERAQNLREAQASLTEAIAGGDPEAIKRAQEDLNDALFDIQRAADEKRAEQERKRLNDRRELQRRHFEEELAALQTRLATGELTQEQAQQRILKLFKKYHIPFRDAAGALGSALAEGLRDSFSDVRKATRELANTIAEELSKLRIVVSVAVEKAGKQPAAKRASGGPVKQGNLYIVGEKGPEFFVPNQSGTIIPNGAGRSSGGNTLVVNMPNYLGERRDVERWLQQMMRRFEDNNGISFTGRALA